MIRVHYIEQFRGVVLWLAVRYLDRYLEAHPNTDKDYFLVGITSLIIAMKLEESSQVIAHYPLEYFLGIGSKNFSIPGIVSMEQELVLLNSGMMIVPTVYFFLSHYKRNLTQSGLVDSGIWCLCDYYSENTLLNAEFSVLPVSQIAAGVLYAAFLCRQQLTSRSPNYPSSPQSIASAFTPPTSPALFAHSQQATMTPLQACRLWTIDYLGWISKESAQQPNWLHALEQTTGLSSSNLIGLGNQVISSLPDPAHALDLIENGTHSILAPFLKHKREGTPRVACLPIPTIPIS